MCWDIVGMPGFHVWYTSEYWNWVSLTLFLCILQIWEIWRNSWWMWRIIFLLWKGQTGIIQNGEWGSWQCLDWRLVDAIYLPLFEFELDKLVLSSYITIHERLDLEVSCQQTYQSACQMLKFLKFMKEIDNVLVAWIRYYILSCTVSSLYCYLADIANFFSVIVPEDGDTEEEDVPESTTSDDTKTKTPIVEKVDDSEMKGRRQHTAPYFFPFGLGSWVFLTFLYTGC